MIITMAVMMRLAGNIGDGHDNCNYEHMIIMMMVMMLIMMDTMIVPMMSMIMAILIA